MRDTFGELHTVGITYAIGTDDKLENIFHDPVDNEALSWITKDDFADYFKVGDHDYKTISKYFTAGNI